MIDDTQQLRCGSCASASTVCPSRWSWRRRDPRPSRRSSWSDTSTSAFGCSWEAAEGASSGTRRCATPSTGPTTVLHERTRGLRPPQRVQAPLVSPPRRPSPLIAEPRLRRRARRHGAAGGSLAPAADPRVRRDPRIPPARDDAGIRAEHLQQQGSPTTCEPATPSTWPPSSARCLANGPGRNLGATARDRAVPRRPRSDGVVHRAARLGLRIRRRLRGSGFADHETNIRAARLVDAIRQPARSPRSSPSSS